MTQLFSAKPFIIAEVGSNWTTFAEAKDAIRFAKNAGAHAVKFQLFDVGGLYGINKIGSPHPTIQNIDQYAISNLDWIPKFKEKADAVGIEFMCSAFSTELYDFVDQYVEVHKIASSELTHPDILEKVKSFGKPILLSCGASSKGDIEHALKILGGAKVVLMYCVAAYPATQYNLFYMQDLKESFDVPIGLSDHSLDVFYTSLSAHHHFDAIAIEKHVNFTEHHTPDSGHSLSHKDFVLMCEMLNGKRDYESFNPMPEEKEMFLKHNRRLIATENIAKGNHLVYGKNFGAYRSLQEDAKGFTPFLWRNVDGKKALANIKIGESINPENCEKIW